METPRAGDIYYCGSDNFGYKLALVLGPNPRHGGYKIIWLENGEGGNLSFRMDTWTYKKVA